MYFRILVMKQHVQLFNLMKDQCCTDKILELLNYWYTRDISFIIISPSFFSFLFNYLPISVISIFPFLFTSPLYFCPPFYLWPPPSHPPLSREKARLATDSELDQDLSERLGLGSSDTLTNGSNRADVAAAKRLAKRLFNLDGFRKSDVARHLSKKWAAGELWCCGKALRFWKSSESVLVVLHSSTAYVVLLLLLIATIQNVAMSQHAGH